MSETVLVVGAGIGGLCTALTLAPSGRQITVLERDAKPPSDDPDTVFHEWRHTGVGQLRQSHAFLARLRKSCSLWGSGSCHLIQCLPRSR